MCRFREGCRWMGLVHRRLCVRHERAPRRAAFVLPAPLPSLSLSLSRPASPSRRSRAASAHEQTKRPPINTLLSTDCCLHPPSSSVRSLPLSLLARSPAATAAFGFKFRSAQRLPLGHRARTREGRAAQRCLKAANSLSHTHTRGREAQVHLIRWSLDCVRRGGGVCGRTAVAAERPPTCPSPAKGQNGGGALANERTDRRTNERATHTDMFAAAMALARARLARARLPLARGGGGAALFRRRTGARVASCNLPGTSKMRPANKRANKRTSKTTPPANLSEFADAARARMSKFTSHSNYKFSSHHHH